MHHEDEHFAKVPSQLLCKLIQLSSVKSQKRVKVNKKYWHLILSIYFLFSSFALEWPWQELYVIWHYSTVYMICCHLLSSYLLNFEIPTLTLPVCHHTIYINNHLSSGICLKLRINMFVSLFAVACFLYYCISLARLAFFRSWIKGLGLLTYLSVVYCLCVC